MLKSLYLKNGRSLVFPVFAKMMYISMGLPCVYRALSRPNIKLEIWMKQTFHNVYIQLSIQLFCNIVE